MLVWVFGLPYYSSPPSNSQTHAETRGCAGWLAHEPKKATTDLLQRKCYGWRSHGERPLVPLLCMGFFFTLLSTPQTEGGELCVYIFKSSTHFLHLTGVSGPCVSFRCGVRRRHSWLRRDKGAVLTVFGSRRDPWAWAF